MMSASGMPPMSMPSSNLSELDGFNVAEVLVAHHVEGPGALLGAFVEVGRQGVKQTAEQVHLGKEQGRTALVEIIPNLL